MATRFIDKASGTGAIRNLPDAAGIQYDTADGVLKYNDAGVIRAVGAKGLATILTPTGATTLTAAESGTEVMLNAAAGFAITLPAPTAGAKFKFTMAAASATTNFTIVSAGGSNIIQGGAIVNSVYVPAVDEDTISFVVSAETIGDYVEVVSDGTSWLVNGVGALAGSITFTAT